MNNFCTIDEAISEIKKGRMLILVDSPRRENEGDFYIPADKVNPQAITTMIRFGGGLICCAITVSRAARLNLPLMVAPLENKEKTKVNFTVSVNAAKGITTGVSAYDRAKSIKVLSNPHSQEEDLVKPGHTFGLVAEEGGVLAREGHTEAAVDLAKLARLNPAGVLCEIVRSNGKMARMPDLVKLSRKLKIKIASIESLVAYLKNHPMPKLQYKSEVVRVASSKLSTSYGTFRMLVYKSALDGLEQVVLLMGQPIPPVLTRIHSQCLSGDTLFSLRCDCGGQLKASLRVIGKAGQGVILYLNQEGRGIGLINKIKAYALQDQGYDTVEANHALDLPSDARKYKIAADILKDLQIHKINLLTNNPDKVNQLTEQGITVVKTTPLELKPNKINYNYLKTKKMKLSHRLSLV